MLTVAKHSQIDLRKHRKMFCGFNIMNQNLKVSAKTFVQVINEGRQKQADLCGKWFSAKETGEQLIRKAQQYLDAYRKYVEFLEKVVELNPKDLDMELNFSKFESILKEATPEAREALLSKYRD
ncbi:hypothetical protein [Bacteroides uniformis]